jgi:PBSX family phage terminase large subunit
MSSFPLSQKYIDFCNTVDNVHVEFLEGTTASGKTTVGAGVKFMRMVSRSNKKTHIIASKTTGTAEKNILQQQNGILDIHRNAVYYGNGNKDNKLPHLVWEDKVIYVLGYDTKEKWQNVLGGQYGCVLIDEINTANIEFVREIITRNDYLMGTLNPDDPNLPIYTEFVNHARPYKKYEADVPSEIMKELLKEEPKPKWRYWFFSFKDNLSLSEADIEKKKLAAPVGTKLYKNKILGLRGKATGLVFSNFDRVKHTITKEEAKKRKYIMFTAGLDTAYSSNSPDTIAMTFVGITDKKECILLDEKVYNNRDLENKVAPSDTIKNLVDFLERNRKEFGFARNVFIDNADAGTITEAQKYKRNNPCLYSFNGAYKKMKIIDRINLQLGWIHNKYFLVVDECKEYIRELETYSWKADKDNEPEDANDHLINSCQYAWLPYVMKIGIEEFIPDEIFI